jgi:hypothetical protein
MCHCATSSPGGSFDRAMKQTWTSRKAWGERRCELRAASRDHVFDVSCAASCVSHTLTTHVVPGIP